MHMTGRAPCNKNGKCRKAGAGDNGGGRPGKMVNRSYGDIVGGMLICALGAFVMTYSERYGMGTLTRMGPGYFPRALGMALVALGVLIAVPGFFRPAPMPVFRLRSFACVLGSLVFFALTLREIGLLGATAGTVLIASLATSQLTWTARAALIVIIPAITWAVFILGLRMMLPVWP
jgi:hypothetical protein